MFMGVLGAFAFGNTATAYAKTRPNYDSVFDKIKAVKTGKANLDPYFDLILDENLANNTYPADKIKDIKNSGHVPLGVKYCTPEIFAKYKNKKSTGPAGW